MWYSLLNLVFYFKTEFDLSQKNILHHSLSPVETQGILICKLRFFWQIPKQIWTLSICQNIVLVQYSFMMEMFWMLGGEKVLMFISHFKEFQVKCTKPIHLFVDPLTKSEERKRKACNVLYLQIMYHRVVVCTRLGRAP